MNGATRTSVCVCVCAKLVVGGVGVTTGRLKAGSDWDRSENEKGNNEDMVHSQRTRVCWCMAAHRRFFQKEGSKKHEQQILNCRLKTPE